MFSAAPPPPVEQETLVKAAPRNPKQQSSEDKPKVKQTLPVLVRSNTTPMKAEPTADTTDQKPPLPRPNFVPVSQYHKRTPSRSNNESSGNSEAQISDRVDTSISVASNSNTSASYHIADQVTIQNDSQRSSKISSRVVTPVQSSTPTRVDSPTNTTPPKIESNVSVKKSGTDSPKAPPKGFDRPLSLSDFIKSNDPNNSRPNSFQNTPETEVAAVPPPPAMFASPDETPKAETAEPESNAKMKSIDVDFEANSEENKIDLSIEKLDKNEKGEWFLRDVESNLRNKIGDVEFETTVEREVKIVEVDFTPNSEEGKIDDTPAFEKKSKEEKGERFLHDAESNQRQKTADIDFEKVPEVQDQDVEFKKEAPEKTEQESTFEKPKVIVTPHPAPKKSTEKRVAPTPEVKKSTEKIGTKIEEKKVSKEIESKSEFEPEESNAKMKFVDVDFDKPAQENAEIKSFAAVVQRQTIEICVPETVGIVKIICKGKEHVLVL